MADRCCGAPLQVMGLGEASAPDAAVALHRCARCQRRSYRIGDLTVTPTEAFAALSGTFARPAAPSSTAPATARTATRPPARREPAARRQVAPTAVVLPDAVPAQVEPPQRSELEALLSGWTVHGS